MRMAAIMDDAILSDMSSMNARWVRIASLIETAKLNDVNPYSCLEATLEAVAACHPPPHIDRLAALQSSTASSIWKTLS